MFDKATGRIIPVRNRILWRRDKPARTPCDDAIAAGLSVSLPTLALNTFQDLLTPDGQLSSGVPSSVTSQGLSFRNFSDGAQITLPMVQGAVAAIPAVGSPLAAAIGGLLTVVRVMDTSIQNREAMDSLTRRLYSICHRMANAPTARTKLEEANRWALIKTFDKGIPPHDQSAGGHDERTTDNANTHPWVLSGMQSTKLMHIQSTKTDYICQAMMMLEGRLPAVVTRLHAFLPGILSECRPDKAHIQKWYIDRGQYDFVIDNGTNVIRLTRESDIWSTIEAGTKIVMRVITTEVSRRLSARYQCYCGKWNEVKVDQVAELDALKGGFTITCQDGLMIIGKFLLRAAISNHSHQRKTSIEKTGGTITI
ncbi:hypothetical protein EDD15DRAFT_2472149 [Pisolithus albus]|nr:hypothetical protein EDD15DRAFT_2472149 [Pisolithus albus]